MADKKVVDARGRSCPEPVLMTKRAIERADSSSIDVLVDTVTSRENVIRFAQNAGWKASASEDGDGFKVALTK